MTELAMKLRLSDEASEKLARRAAESGRDLAAVASDLIEQAVSVPAPNDSTAAQRVAAWDRWVATMREWGQNHLPAGHVVDDSRDSIYEGRGE
jgi:hypothetical protein